MNSVQETRFLGMQAAEQNAAPDLKKVLLDCISTVAKQRKEFSTDNVWTEFESRTERPYVYDGSVIGPMMTKACKAGILQRKQGASVTSQRPSTHGRLLRVFTSLVFEAEG